MTNGAGARAGARPAGRRAPTDRRAAGCAGAVRSLTSDIVAARVCVVGSVNLDLTFNVDALPERGETVLAHSMSSAPGGKGGNQAVAAARAGADVELIAALGDDAAGERLRSHLRDNGVGLDGVTTVAGPSGSAVIVVDSDAENTIVVAPGANAALTIDAEGDGADDSASAGAIIAASDVVLMQLEIPAATAVAAARRARAAGAVVIVNASPAGAPSAELQTLAGLTDVVVVNETEARQWRWPVPHLVVTRGAAGARYQGVAGAFDVPAPEVAAVDSTGAGDVFAGVLAAEWHTGPQRAVRRACAAGALATLIPGAGDCAPYSKAIDGAIRGDVERLGDP